MKEPLVQALLCLLAAAGLYVLAGKTAGDVHDGIIALAGIAGTLWLRLPQNDKGKSIPPAAGVLLLAVGLAVGQSSCSPASRQTQMNVVEVATQAANELGNGIVQLYGLQAQYCVDSSTNENEYAICKMSVDQAWGKATLSYAALRMTQAEYATALEKGSVDPAQFLDWFRLSYCELKASAPPELILPPIPGLTCGENVQ